MCIHYEKYKLAYTLHITGTKMDLKENKNHHTKKKRLENKPVDKATHRI